MCVLGGCPWKFYSMHIINSFVVRGLGVLSYFILSVPAYTGVIICRVNEAQGR